MKMNKQRMACLTVVALTGALVSVGCKQENSESAQMGDPATGYGFRSGTNTNQMVRMPVQPDNTRVNVRDRAGDTLTPGDQGATEADRDLTQQIRKNLSDDNTLSNTAKNVKIITANRRVTLRGPVATEAEKATINTVAKGIAGEGNVEDQLEVKPNP